MELNSSLLQISGLGHYYAKKLEYLGIKTVWDLLNHYPFRYDDFSQISTVNEAKVGEKVSIIGEIWSIKNIFTRNKKLITTAIFNDGESPIELTWFNQSWLIKQIKTGDRLQVSGKLTKYKNKLSIMAPVWERAATGLPSTDYRLPTLHTGRLVPVYPETSGLTSKFLRTKISHLLPLVKHQIEDPLPEEIKNGMLSLPDAIEKIHFPDSWAESEKARERLGFDELFYIQLATLKARHD